MSLESDIAYLIKQHDDPSLYRSYKADIEGGPTPGEWLAREMRDALERLIDRMCRECEGNGFINKEEAFKRPAELYRNPHARYSEEYADGRRTGVYSTNDPEEISCPRCGGVGFCPPEGIEKLPELYEVSEEPF